MKLVRNGYRFIERFRGAHAPTAPTTHPQIRSTRRQHQSRQLTD
eukprot:COSAG02_NODE_63598_length_263_cov_0.317073_1_plen_43_part_10